MEPLLRLIDRKLQETTGLDFISSYTSAGVTTIFVNLKGSTTRSEVPEIWRRVRKNRLRKSLGVSEGNGAGDDDGLVFWPP